TGVVNGQQAVFIGDQSYWMSDIMAVGRLPGEEKADSVESGSVENNGGYSSSGGGYDGSFQVTDGEPEGT
ncbi:MAG: hypothetical protein IJT94_05650, partial [Oscillibacter sp.]|nr:hypothetical protein [Oscillibacter sp.]